jgi:nucleotide sugar dehydrogenase
MKFVVIGHGFVGQAMDSVLSDKHTVAIIDPHKGFDDSVDKHSDADGFVICVPTPEADNGRVDDTLVVEYIKAVREHCPNSKILIKSTTSVDVLREYDFHNVAFSPEFLSSSTSADTTQQFRDCTFAIYGGDAGRFWHSVFGQLVTINDVRFLDIKDAGFLKYTENAFLALKVTFFNELRQLYDADIGVNYDAMIEALALDKRIGMSHTQVPGPDGRYGFGGHCLPKDTSEFVEYGRAEGHPLQLLELARKLNVEFRNK